MEIQRKIDLLKNLKKKTIDSGIEAIIKTGNMDEPIFLGWNRSMWSTLYKVFEDGDPELNNFKNVKLFGRVVAGQIDEFTAKHYVNDLNIIINYLNDLIEELKEELEYEKSKIKKIPLLKKNSNTDYDRTKIFIVHGHDNALKSEVARVIEKLKLEPIILHEQANSGRTIIEKLEEYTNVGYGIVLYTPCDEGAKKGETLKPRARQNVIFEHGLLIGKLTRERVATLVKSNVELPGDISGTVYTSANEGWKYSLVGELKKLGYDVDANDLL